MPLHEFPDERASVGDASRLRLALCRELPVSLHRDLSLVLVRLDGELQVVHRAFLFLYLTAGFVDRVVELREQVLELIRGIRELGIQGGSATRGFGDNRFAPRLDLAAFLDLPAKRANLLLSNPHRFLRRRDLLLEQSHLLPQRSRRARVFLPPRPQLHRVVFLDLELVLDQTELFDLRALFLLELGDVLQRLGVLGGGEDFVKLLFQGSRFA
mmetsp:Transcript_3511/g.12981  ORF Transcript_3511/g.12981 Transcript_3511/m.12981 type:complete len:213 (+) Transcript_3511:4195-4833(+)